MHLEDQPWRDEAKCKGRPASVFFPVDSVGVAEAQRICDGCPAREPCAEWGIANEDFGVWGGLSERERSRLRRQRRTARTMTKVRTRGRPAA